MLDLAAASAVSYKSSTPLNDKPGVNSIDAAISATLWSLMKVFQLRIRNCEALFLLTFLLVPQILLAQNLDPLEAVPGDLVGTDAISNGLSAQKIGLRNAHAMVFDDQRQRLVLFGGADEARVLGDTWEWDGSRWKRVSVSGPGPRTFPVMAYDRLRRRVVLFGGNRVLFGRSAADNHYLNDTWEWDGKRWIQMNVPGPSPRSEAAIAFDAARGRTVLFGGHTVTEKERHWLGDTWEWDGKTWLRKHVDGPSPRNSPAMAYDSIRKKVVLFGGRTSEGLSGETWEWDGTSWVEVITGHVEGRFNSVMAYDESRQVMIRFGGRFGGKGLGDTWQYDGLVWKRLTTNGPVPRNHTSMAYDPRGKRMLLFGGHDTENVFGDLWEWNGTSWRLLEDRETKKHLDTVH